MQNFLEYAQARYYAGYPVISDDEYDALEKKYGSSSVGYKIPDGLPHMYQMYSLQKCFNNAEAPLPVEDCIVTPKLDGAAVSLLYFGGELQLALTRGDGKIGKDITDKMATLAPLSVSFKDTRQITGEVVCPSRIKNARNVAAGSLNLKDLSEFKERPLKFIAYDMQPMNYYPMYTLILDFLSREGFSTIIDCDWPQYPQDGQVYRLASNEEYRKLGFTSHHPRGAYALKEKKAGVVTKLVDVVWQVGKSGVVSPVAMLDPIEIDGATIQKATLHNIEYIESLGLEIGCQVEVIRSGDIIPRVVCRVD